MIVVHVSSVASLKNSQKNSNLVLCRSRPSAWFSFRFSPFPIVLYIPILPPEGVVKSRLPFARKISTPDTGFIGLHRGNKGWSTNQDRTNISWYKIIYIYRKYLFDEWKNVEDNLIVLPDFENKNSASFFLTRI